MASYFYYSQKIPSKGKHIYVKLVNSEKETQLEEQGLSGTLTYVIYINISLA